jgi:Zn-dependent membrane protease YugP
MIDWILGLVMAVFAILGLVLASGAYDTGMYTFGLLLFAFGIFFDFWLVKKSFDAKERAASAAVEVPEIKAAAD